MSKDQVLAPDFLDEIAFYLAVASVDRILVTMGENPASVSGVDPGRLQKHRIEAAPILRRISGAVDAGIDSLLRDAADKAKLRVKTRLDAALRGAAAPSYAVRAEFLEFFLPRLKAHGNVVRDVFGDVSSQATRVIYAAEVEAPVARLYKLAGIRMAAGGKLSLLKRWTQEATEICGNPVSEIEEVAVDVAAVDAVLDRVTKNNRKLDTLDPTDPASAAVSEENAELLDKVSRVADKSKDPASVKAHAAARVSKGGPDGGFASTISAHLRMTPEQEDAMIVRGKAVIAAGAGSGKTRVLAGKVIHHCQDLGLSLSNVMAVSFTVKSSGELKERIVKYGKDVGYNLPNPDSNWDAYAGIGTTHSIGRGILKKSGGGWKVNPMTDTIKGAEISKLMRVAILQVKMLASGGSAPLPPPNAMTFFPNVAPRANRIEEPERSPADRKDPALETKSPVQNPVEAESPLKYYLQEEGRFRKLLEAAIDTVTDFLSAFPAVKTFPASANGWYRAEVYGPGIVRFGDALAEMKINGSGLSYKEADAKYRAPNRFVAFSKREFDAADVVRQIREELGGDKAENAIKALKSLLNTPPSELTENEMEILEGIITNPLVSAGLTQRNVLVRTATNVHSILLEKKAKKPKKAADENGDEGESPYDNNEGVEVSEEGIETASKRKLKKLDYPDSPYYHFIHNPANQWFNIGATEDDFREEDRDGKKKDIPLGEFARFTGFNKNSLKAPGAIFLESQNALETGIGEDEDDGLTVKTSKNRIFAAVYGAYEWLKGNMPDMKGRLDYDDQLIVPSRELIEKPALLTKYQKQYKCVLVDEAQDLNAAQHLMFGLIAGYIDPMTLAPRKDGKMSADTFALIGDDKQAIYEFRAADPSKFIEKSDLIPGGEGFTTKLLDTNFRSGNAIVEAANKLITFNTKRIPMICKTDPGRGDGAISRLQAKTVDDLSELMTETILAEQAEAKQDGNSEKFFSRFGLAVRTNKEVYAFAMKMIEKGIPFRSKKNFLAGPAIGPVIGIFTILRTDDLATRNAGVIAGLNAPDFGLNPRTVSKKLEELGVQDYYDFLVNKKGAKRVYSYKRMVDNLQDYADYIEEVVRVGEKGSATEVIDMILNQKGPDGDTFVDTLSASLMDDAEAMEEIQMKADAENEGIITPDMLAEFALAPIDPLRKAAKRFPTAMEFVNYIRSLVESNKRNPKEDGDSKADAVQIDTVHGWKGLEIENLYIPMWDGGFPHARSRGNEENMASERRLAYVALTRGRNRVTILEPTIVKGKPTEPSQFVIEGCIPLIGTAANEAKPDMPPEEGLDLKTASVANFLLPTRSEPSPGPLVDFGDPSLAEKWS